MIDLRPIPRRAALLLVVGAFLVSSAARSELPLASQNASPIAHGRVALDFAVGYRRQARDFALADRDRQWDLGETRLTAGLGDWVELQLSGIVQSSHRTSVAIDGTDGAGGAAVASRSDSDFGDWRLGTKIRLLEEGRRRPAIGFLWEVKLPNASRDSGVGTDETDFFALALFSKSLSERDRLDVNAGIGLLGRPDRNSRQDDVSIVRVAWHRRLGQVGAPSSAAGRGLWTGLEWTLVDGFVPGDSPVTARGAFGRDFATWSFYGALAVGLNNQADDWSAAVGFRRRFDLSTR